MKLYLLSGCPFAHRATIALREKGIAFEPVVYHERPKELDAISPHAKSPTLFEDDGTVVWESLIVLEYLDERYPDAPLFPREPRARAEVRMLQARVAREIEPKQGLFVREIFFNKGARDEAKIAEGVREMRAALAPFDALLANRAWLAGSALTAADLTLYTIVQAARRLARFDVELPHLDPWLARLESRPSAALVT